MVIKHSKDTFRHTKKNVLHKKRVNSKKRGLWGGDPKLIIDDDRTLHSFRGKFALTSLNDNNCNPWIQKVDEDETKNKTNVKLVPGSQGYKDYYGCLNVLGRYVSFDTTLTTKSNPETLTLKGCKAIKKSLELVNPMFKYEIFSPAATTTPPSGGTQQDTHVGTFTQLSISQMLDIIKKEIVTSFDNIFHPQNIDGNALREDYFTCLKHVQTQFGPNVMTSASVSQSEKFRSVMLSKLCQFGKGKECKIVFRAGNIGKEIQDPNNNGAIFVLPSQFNGAEYQSPRNPLIDLNEYKLDYTGGPLGQLSCHPAVAQFVMNHAARTAFNSKFLVINAVDDVILSLGSVLSLGSGKLVLNNGYLEVKDDTTFTLKKYTFISDITSKMFELFCQKLKVLQTDDVPTSGLTPANVYTSFNSEATSKVSLIYASAVPLNYYDTKPPINPEKSLLQYSVAGFNLVGQYFGAMVSAYNKKKQREDDVVKMADVTKTADDAVNALGKPEEAEAQKKHLDAVRAVGGHIKLFLTPLGGGVFHNPREMIACSVLLAYYMARQMLLNFDQKVEVIFLAWDSKDHEGNYLMRNGKKTSVEDDDFNVFFKKAGEEPQALDSGLELSEENPPAADEAPESDEESSAIPVILESSESLTQVDLNHPSNVPPNVLRISIQSDDTESSPSNDTKISLPQRLANVETTTTTLPETAAKTKKEHLDEFKRLKKSKEEEKKKLIEKYNAENLELEEEIKKNKEKFGQHKLATSGYNELFESVKFLEKKKDEMKKKYEKELQGKDYMILNCKRVIYLIENNITLPETYEKKNYNQYMIYANMLYVAENDLLNPLNNKILEHKKSWIEGFNRQQEEEQKERELKVDVEGGGSKSQRRHRRHRKPARKTRRGRTRKSKVKSKTKTHRRRRHSRVRKHKKYTRKR